MSQSGAIQVRFEKDFCKYHENVESSDLKKGPIATARAKGRQFSLLIWTIWSRSILEFRVSFRQQLGTAISLAECWCISLRRKYPFRSDLFSLQTNARSWWFAISQAFFSASWSFGLKVETMGVVNYAVKCFNLTQQLCPMRWCRFSDGSKCEKLLHSYGFWCGVFFFFVAKFDFFFQRRMSPWFKHKWCQLSWQLLQWFRHQLPQVKTCVRFKSVGVSLCYLTPARI